MFNFLSPSLFLSVSLEREQEGNVNINQPALISLVALEAAQGPQPFTRPTRMVLHIHEPGRALDWLTGAEFQLKFYERGSR